MFSATTSGASGVSIANVFSTSLYTGNGSTQTITNGIDLAGQGGLVWLKGRSPSSDHALYDTIRGATKNLVSNSQAAEVTQATGLTAFSSTGFSLGALSQVNSSSETYASWTFRKQPKFFDVVTYTGNGATFEFRTHNLQSFPGAIFIKATSTTGDWFAWCRTSPTDGSYLKLNSTAAQVTTGNAGALSYAFPVGTSLAGVNTNASGVTYVAYLFASDAGGFGPYGTDNAISCGSFTTDGSGNATVTHGFTNGAQFCMIKGSTVISNWEMFDTQRTPSWTSADARLYPNLSSAEDTVNRLSGSGTSLTFAGLSANETYVYMLIAAPV